MAHESPFLRPQLAFFDHVYAVVDALTAESVARCEYLRDFGRFVVGTTTADGETWTGRYLFGRRTYLELFGPTDLQGSEGAKNSTGIGLSTHHRGDIAILAERISDHGGNAKMGQTTRQEDHQDIAWFDHLAPLERSHGLEVWVMEFLEDPGDLELREAAFETWAENRTEAEPGRRRPTLGEIRSVELDASASDIAATAPLLKAAGFAVSRLRDMWTVSDTQTTIILHAQAFDAAALRRIEFALDFPATSIHIETLGRSTLTVGPGRRALWDFKAPSTKH
jgi:hypothetical protein